MRSAIAEAEAQTAAEFVPVIAAASARYERAEDLVGLFGAVLMAAVTVVALEALPGDPMLSAVRVLAVVLAVCAGAALGVVVAKRWSGLRRGLISRSRRVDDVQARADQVFVRREVYQTAGGTGVMLYLSLFEQRSAIILDSLVADRVDRGQIDAWRRRLDEAITAEQESEGLVAVIREIGHSLADLLPNHASDRNELPDNIVTIDD